MIQAPAEPGLFRRGKIFRAGISIFVASNVLLPNWTDCEATTLNEMQQTLRATWMAGPATARRNTAVQAIGGFLRSLRGRHDWPGSTEKRAWIAAKYLVRCLTMPRKQSQFLSLIESEPMLHALRRRDPRMLERHFHRYINRNWSRGQRLNAIQQHYVHALHAMPAPLFRAVYAEGSAPLGLLTMKDDSRLVLSLHPPIFMGCEGELCIQLGDELGNPLYRVVVTVIACDTLAIGCIQGPVGSEARETVRELTRNLHGLRPRCLMLALVGTLARHWGLSKLFAVGNAAHPLRNPRRRFVADYDTYWEEQRGRATADGWYELPLQPKRKTEADVPSQHRSAFRKREALRMEAECLLVDALGKMLERHDQYEQHAAGTSFNQPLQEACAVASCTSR